MRKTVGMVLLAAVGVAVLWSLLTTPMSLLDLLKQPLVALWGSHQRLSSGVLEITDNIEPLEAATHQLLKPFGAVRIIRHTPASNPPSNAPQGAKDNDANR